ncbi:MAG: glycolate oxidase subunit GlcF [Alphaproteobacteria bacterium]|nr:glycolate oxidase subunit GlcF [Alphaproteobacteria bacterium]MBV9693771.1 glycolate oxidase subunit GlcF [Alphaproteobacteria bacterium]
MRTNFTPSQLCDPHLKEAERNLRTCVHCGICTATCPTYVLTGDERDGPRGRIAMMQQMLEDGGAPSAQAVHHIDRCLSCLGCRTACPSGVDYARLVDAARLHIHDRHRRPLAERLLRWLIANVLPRPKLVRAGLWLAPLGRLLPGRLGVMARIGTGARARPGDEIWPTRTRPIMRVALIRGCVQAALAPQTDAAIARVLARRGFEAMALEGCCGALVHHMGRDAQAKAFARRLIEAFERSGAEMAMIGASGCSAHLKDMTQLFAHEPAWQARAQAFVSKTRDLLELVDATGEVSPRVAVAWQAPCSLQNGLKLADKGRQLLAACGFEVREPVESHLCCGSAGTYAILEPDLAKRLRERKRAHLAALGADIVASANIGCQQHLSGPGLPPVVHLAELVDWADGGAMPRAMR